MPDYTLALILKLRRGIR